MGYRTRPGIPKASGGQTNGEVQAPVEQDAICDYAVLGGGLAGLTLALDASRRGRRVAVLEAGPQVGGLARTLVFGDYRFDFGGHRFYSTMPGITQWVRDLLGDDLLEVERRSRIRLGNRYVDYPLRIPGALTAFPAATVARVALSYGRSALHRSRKEPVSFEGWIVQRFGRALYEIYFRPYTEKVWGIACSELSADWASRRIQLGNLAAAVRESLSKRRRDLPTLASRFLYPGLGIGELPTRVAEQALATGRAALHLDSRVVSLAFDVDRRRWHVGYRHAGRRCEVLARHVVSTIPLPSLLEMLPGSGAARSAASGLTYRSLICIFVAAEGPRVSTDTWTYFPDRHVVFGRIHEPANWSPHMAPSGRTSLCLELFCSEDDAVWRRADGDLIGSALDDLAALGVLARSRVQECWLVRVPDAYPVYRVGYAERLQGVRTFFSQWPTLHLTGRTGAFRYLNMDGVIDDALRLSRELDAPEAADG